MEKLIIKLPNISKYQLHEDARTHNDLLDMIGYASRAKTKAEQALNEMNYYHETMVSFLDRISERHKTHTGVQEQLNKT